MRASQNVIRWLVATTCLIASTAPIWADAQALIVTGLSGSAANAGDLSRMASATADSLKKRGFSKVEILQDKVTRDIVLEKLRAIAADMHADDEFWLVLYGHSGRGQDGKPAFQISGPRLTTTDLKDALDAIAARQFFFAGTNESGDYLPPLINDRRTVLAATKSSGESDQPRFPAAWVRALAEDPSAEPATIAARAAALVEEEYKTSKLAQTEHARMTDPSSGKILAPPFGANLPTSPPSPRIHPEPAPLISASEIEVKINDPNAEWENQPATEETKRIAEEGRSAPNPEGHPAVMLEQRLGFTVDEDRTTDTMTLQRIYIASDEALEKWGNFYFPQSPPNVSTKLELARVIQADGSTTVYNPAKLPGAIDLSSEGATSTVMVHLPNVKAGCVVEIAYRTRALLNATLPHVSEELSVQQDIPVLKTVVEARVPDKPLHRVALRHASGQMEESEAPGQKTTRWTLGPLPAAEHLPGDPPSPFWKTTLSISSLASWDEFARWHQRLSKGSDEITDAVRQAADNLVAGASSRMEKIRRSFEFVAGLRYVAIEMGVQGLRPRTPTQVLNNRFGDCKDKANLLIALLKTQGIDANFVILNRGLTTDVSFPSWQFNHAICYVPKNPQNGQPDDLWLDTTDSVTPFGSVPPGDYGRPGLVFSADKAEFKTITIEGDSKSELKNIWTLRQNQNGEWEGRVQGVTSGFAEDEARRTFWPLSPQQRQMVLYGALTALWPAADFSNEKLAGISSIKEPVVWEADVRSPNGSLPTISIPDLKILAAPERDRPLWLNDSQPVTLSQIVELTFHENAPEKLPEAWSSDAAGQRLNISWKRVDAKTIRREARLELANPKVTAADYVALRAAYQKWSRDLRQPGDIL